MKGKPEESKSQQKKDGRLPIVLFWVCLLAIMNIYFTTSSTNTYNSCIISSLDVTNQKLLYLKHGERNTENSELLPASSYPFFFLPIPINSAEQELLMTVKGIGGVLAESIITHRRHVGPILNFSDFQKIPGVGEKRAASLMAELTFDSSQ